MIILLLLLGVLVGTIYNSTVVVQTSVCKIQDQLCIESLL